jgi:hypothetical protein
VIFLGRIIIFLILKQLYLFCKFNKRIIDILNLPFYSYFINQLVNIGSAEKKEWLGENLLAILSINL